jgi:hypothetical protein
MATMRQPPFAPAIIDWANPEIPKTTGRRKTVPGVLRVRILKIPDQPVIFVGCPYQRKQIREFGFWKRTKHHRPQLRTALRNAPLTSILPKSGC